MPVKLSVKCNADVEQNATIAFHMYPEGSNIKTTKPEAQIRGVNINGIAESQEICWGVKDKNNPPEAPNKYFFTAQTNRSPYVTSDVFEVKLPEFSNLLWKKDGKNIEIAFDNEYAVISCDTKNIPDYTRVIVEIYESGEDNADIHITDLEGKILDNKLEMEWKVDYREVTGTKSKKEIEEKGYTLPEYHFYVRHFGFRSGASPAVRLKCNFIERAMDKNGNPIPDTGYILISPDGQQFRGVTDKKGFVRQNDLYIGKYNIIIAN